MSFTFGVTFLLIAGGVFCTSTKIPCPDPIAPEHGEAFLYQEGRVVKYACEPGYALKGKEIVGCIDGKWEDANPTCVENEDKSKSADKSFVKDVESGTEIQLNTSTTDEMLQGDEGYQSDDALQQLYWYAHYYHNAPPVLTLTDSQLRWIDSLHPELRDKYLRGMYIVRTRDSSEPERVASIVARDAYDYIYRVPYVRRAASLSVEDTRFTYDYSCSQTGYPFIKAPRLPNMRIARYDTRQNPINSYKYYLSAIYQCNAGYRMRDNRYTELYCSNQNWVGVRPICDRND